MKKFLALLMALSMVLSLCMVPVVSADEIIKTVVPQEGRAIFTDKIEDITDNLLYPSSAGFVNGGFTVEVREQARSHKNDLQRAGVIKSTDSSPQKILHVYSYDNDGTKSPTLEDAYKEGYDTLIIGNGIADEYSGNAGAAGYAIAGSPFKGAFVKSVASPTDENNKVLHYSFGTNGENDSNCSGGHYRGIVTHIFAGKETKFTKPGQKMVYSWKVYIPDGVQTEFIRDSYQALGGIAVGSNKRLLQDRTYYQGGYFYYDMTGDDVYDKSNNPYFTLNTNTWYTFRQTIVFDGTAYPTVTMETKTGDNGAWVERAKLISTVPLKGNETNGYSAGQLWIAGGPRAGSSAKDTFNFYVDEVMQYMLKGTADLSITSATASVVDGKVSAAVTVENSIGMDLPAFIAVAVYGANDEMLGIKFVNANVTSSGYTGTLEVDVQNRSSEIVKAKAFLWESVTNMVPYQDAVDVTVQ